ncbi:hypothetical protein N0V85_002873 [Neurospora sp. IMI 360204]|nr:hypothetical protein N0V85_002873 [Neurospora sp. IMI 360204]
MEDKFDRAFARFADVAGDKLCTYASLFVAVATITICYNIFRVVKQWRRLHHIPGPFINGFSKLPLLSWEFKQKVNLEGYEFHKKYGPVARVSPDMVLTSDPELVKRAMNVRTNYTRSDWYGVLRFDPGKDNVVSQRDDVLHNKLRAKMAAGYSGREVDALEPRVDKNIQEFIRLLDTKYISQGQAFDFARKVQYFTLDIISDIAYGKPFGYLREDKDLWDFIGTLESQMRGVMMAAIYPWIVDLLSHGHLLIVQG